MCDIGMSEANGDYIDTLVLRVEAAVQDEWVELEDLGHALKRVQFEFDKREKDFIWCGERSWKNARNSGWVHPLKNSQYVKSFKTLNGAKRNFLKRYAVDYAFPNLPNSD